MPFLHLPQGAAFKPISSSSTETMDDVEGLLPDEKAVLLVETGNYQPDQIRKRVPSMFCAGVFMVVLSIIVIIVTIMYPAGDDGFCYTQSTYYSKGSFLVSWLSFNVQPTPVTPPPVKELLHGIYRALGQERVCASADAARFITLQFVTYLMVR
jgi:hypothetical protein